MPCKGQLGWWTAPLNGCVEETRMNEADRTETVDDKAECGQLETFDSDANLRR